MTNGDAPRFAIGIIRIFVVIIAVGVQGQRYVSACSEEFDNLLPACERNLRRKLFCGSMEL